MKQQQQQKKPTISTEEHHKMLTKKDEIIKQLQGSLEKQKHDGLNMAADYKKRLVEQQGIAEQKKAALTQALDAADAMRKEFEERIAKLNQRHGATVRQLREANEALMEELKCHTENAEEPVAEPNSVGSDGKQEG